MTGLRLLVLLALLLSSGAISKEMTSLDPPPLTPLCASDEPGEKLEFWGRVLDYQGRPLAKASVVAYQADRAGLYAVQGATQRVPRLRNVAVTDSAGRYGFVTIRPGSYPDRSQPAHIHLVVTAPAHHVRHLEYWFRGDPLITPAMAENARGDSPTVIVDLARDRDGAWTFQQDIRLEGD